MSSEVAVEMYGGRWKRYPAYRDSGVEWIGGVPEGWDVLRLKKVAHFGYGNSLAAEDRVPGDYYVYGSNGIVGKHEISNTKEPCLIIGRKGSFGKVVYSEKSCFAIDTTYFIDSTLTNNNLRWLFYCLQWLQLDSFSKDSAVPGLAREDAYQNLVPFCSLNEQRAIAAFLDRETGRIDTLIEKKGRQIELLQEKRAALISHAVTKGLDPDVKMKDSGVEWLGEFPEHWEMLALKRLASLKSGESITVESIDKDGDYPVFGGNGLRGYTTTFTHDGNYVLIGRQGALCGNINYAQGQFWASEHAVVVSPIGPVETKWLGELLRAMNLNQYSVSAAQPGLSVEMVSNLSIPQPPLQEQSTIATFLNRKTGHIDILTTKVYESISKLREYRTALISAAVTGKIDVRNKET